MDYKNGKIYVIRNHINDKVYIGGTTTTLTKRLSWHKTSNRKYKIYQAFKEIGVDHFYIELVEDYPCNSKSELTTREGFFIRQFDSYVNGYNMRIAGRNQKEYNEDNKEHLSLHNKNKYDNNKDIYIQKSKDYSQKNKEKVAEYKKEYALKNKEQIAAYRQENNTEYTCECGSVLKKYNKSTHEKTIKHQEYIKNKNISNNK